MLTHGADVVALERGAARLRRQGDAVADLSSQASRAVGRLAQVWSGPDADAAQASWRRCRRDLDAWAEAVARMAKALDAQSAAQRRTSESGGGEGPGAGVSGGFGPGWAPGIEGGLGWPVIGPWPVVDPWAEGQSRDAEHYGRLPREVDERWRGFTDEERQTILTEIIEERAEHYGIGMPQVEFRDEPGGANGSWSEGESHSESKVMLHNDVIDDPMILHTVFHELRHGGQHEAVEDADVPWWAFWQDPVYENGVTEEQVQAWEENFENYIPAREDYDGYFNQPVEVDARGEGSTYLEGMTAKELERLLREGQE